VSIVERNVSLTMTRPNLDGVPAYPVPAGHAIRPYRPGDERAWFRIQSAADRYNRITPESLRQEFGDDRSVLGRRLLFLYEPGGTAIGTAAAWFGDDRHAQDMGRVHWVAIDPAHQGRGLSKPLLSTVCTTLAEMGHDEAYLVTSSGRIAAIRLYLLFGFVPVTDAPDAAAAWSELEPILRSPRPAH